MTALTKKDLMISIERGLQNLYKLDSNAVDYFNDIVYDRNDKLLASRCTPKILKQIEDQVMRLTIEANN